MKKHCRFWPGIAFLFVLFVSVFLYSGANADEAYDKRVNEFFKKAQYKDGASWGDNKWDVNHNGIGCNGFVRDFAYYCWKNSPTSPFVTGKKFTNPAEITDGDLIYINYWDDDGKDHPHWYAVVKRVDDVTLWTAEGNYLDKVRVGTGNYSMKKLNSGKQVFQHGFHMPGYTPYVPKSDKKAPVVSNVRIDSQDPYGYTIKCDLTDDTGISMVRFATWTDKDWQDDIVWNDIIYPGDSASLRVDISKHGNQTGKYLTYIYAYDVVGKVSEENDSTRAYVFVDNTPPTIQNIRVTEVTNTGYKIVCDVSDNIGVTRVAFPTWTDKNWKDDILWLDGSLSADRKKATFEVKISDHNNESGDYLTYVYAFDASGNCSEENNSTRLKVFVDGTPPVVSNVRISDLSNTGYTIKCDVSDDAGVTRVSSMTWTDENGQDDIVRKDGDLSGNTASFHVDISDHNNQYGDYTSYIYAYDKAGNVSKDSDATHVKISVYPDPDFILPSGLTIIENESFTGIKARTVVIPAGCTTIGPRAFADCPNLVYVYIPATVTSIAEDAFAGCGDMIIYREE